MKISEKIYNQLLDNIGSTLQKARENAIKAINSDLVKANWEIGRHIVEFEQQGKEKADYGSALLTNLARDLKQNMAKVSVRVIFTCAGCFISSTKNSRQCLEN